MPERHPVLAPIYDEKIALLEGEIARLRSALTAERERCAKIAENTYLNDIGQIGARLSIGQVIAQRIRNPEQSE
jgi:hypothetical protein